jgi:arylsulfatase A-like enzyme
MKKNKQIKTSRKIMSAALLFSMAAGSGCNMDSNNLGVDPRPNFVTIVLDDMGYSDFGIYGSEIQTPNIDGLVTNGSGIMFTNFYANATSTPARGMLFTGKSNHGAGVGTMEGWIAFREEHEGTVGYEGVLSRDAVPFPEVLANNGYHTMFTGKWDLGHKRGYTPSDRGFQHVRAAMLMGGDTHFSEEDGTIITSHQSSKYKSKNRQSWYNDEGKEMIRFEKEFYSTDYYTDMALDMLANRDTTKPFYLNITHIAPHAPVQAKKEDIDKYLNLGYYNDGYEKVLERRLAKMYSTIVPGTISRTVFDDADPSTNAAADAKRTLDFYKDTTKYEGSTTSRAAVAAGVDWDALNTSYTSSTTGPTLLAVGKNSDYENSKDYQVKVMAAYAGMIDRIDQNVGRVVQYLKDIGEYDNTVIFIMSDNGGAYKLTASNNPARLGHLNTYFSNTYENVGGKNSFNVPGAGWALVSCSPFNWFKGDFFDGGIRVPLIVHWPKTQFQGITRRLSSIMDIAPTILQMAGISYPDTYNGRANSPMLGKSIAGMMNSGSESDSPGHDYLAWELDGGKGLRQGQYKISQRTYSDSLGRTCTDDEFALYDVSADPTEHTPIYSSTNKDPNFVNIYTQLTSLYEVYARQEGIVYVDHCRPLLPPAYQ